MNPLKNKYSLLFCLLLCSHTALSFAERGDRDKPIHIEADHVVVDDARQVSTFEGNVQMRQGTLLIEASKIVVTQDKKGFNQMTATGQPAHFRQKRDGVDEYAEGYGERIVYDTLAETADLFGQARVQRGGDDVRGEHIIYNTKTAVFQVFGTTVKNPDTPNQGRVTIVIQPKEKPDETAPDAPTLPIKPSTTLTPPKP